MPQAQPNDHVRSVNGAGARATVGRRVFISSASGALAPYRQAAVDVCHRIGMTPVHMEEFDPQRPTPFEVCRERLGTCHVFVLLLAHRYGSRPPGQPLSYTELEYEWATARTDLPLLPFLVDPNFAWPPPDVDHGSDAEALAQFRARVSRQHVVRRFAEVAKFREDLLLALRPYEQAAGAADEHEAAAVSLPAPPAFHAVPPYVGSAPFTGRGTHLARLDDWGGSADPVLVVEAIGGTGKSALTWEWASNRAGGAIDDLAGRLWWSFYEGSASMGRFLREVLAYTTGAPLADIRRLPRADLAAQAVAALRARPYLLVLDGFERLLRAYHRLDPSKVRDDEADTTKRSMIDTQAEDLLRNLTAVGPSKILISTRLMPDALTRFGRPIPGVRHIQLPGLTEADTATLLGRLGVRGSRAALSGFFRRLDNHPLLIGIVAGLVRDYRPEPGGFDRWLGDTTAGGALGLPDLDLTQRRTHILAAALADLAPGSKRLLDWLSVLAGSVEWTTLEAINPFRPAPPQRTVPDLDALGSPSDPFEFRSPSPGDGVQGADSETENYDAGADRWVQWHAARDRMVAAAEREYEQRLAAWKPTEPGRARAQLDQALKDLEERGLLWWDRAANSYDMHPIIRAYVHDRLDKSDRVQANTAVRDHFQALPPEDPSRATSVEDLRHTITIFRALVGAGLLAEADSLWRSGIGKALLVELGAYPTVIELLTPLAADGTWFVRGDLTLAYHLHGRLDEAIRQETAILADALRDEHTIEVGVSLQRCAVGLDLAGRWLLSERLLDLRAELTAATGGDPERDAVLILSRSTIDGRRGRTNEAYALLNAAARLIPPTNSPWFTDGLHANRLRLAQFDGTLTSEQLTRVDQEIHSSSYRIALTMIRCRFEIQRGDFAAALVIADQGERLARNSGQDTVPALQAFLLTKLGRPAEAAAAIEESLLRLPRLPASSRPHHHLAQALQALGRHDEAVHHAHEAYRQAWHDGPPHHDHWALRDARELLADLGESPPDLPVTDPATVKAPLEDEVRTFIAKARVERLSGDPEEAV
ncbi:DUF4062 domain-containing protein [Catellatospora tritici]|uniref:DUF4062 domain-containing protein n=1 Tax=Catellatospora tritici TaxID=2851566 RepID=UPI001C2D431F|nr:DUF4062 domain-containing protein [Catellatospora tritici]MBV1856322.1 DUF4062 domain-containing protein [Catellatospora tritici]